MFWTEKMGSGKNPKDPRCLLNLKHLPVQHDMENYCKDSTDLEFAWKLQAFRKEWVWVRRWSQTYDLPVRFIQIINFVYSKVLIGWPHGERVTRRQNWGTRARWARKHFGMHVYLCWWGLTLPTCLTTTSTVANARARAWRQEASHMMESLLALPCPLSPPP